MLAWLRKRPEVLLTLFFLPLAMLVTETGLLRRFDYLLLDPMLRLRAAQEQPDPRLLVVDIDERSIRAMEQYVGAWPWPRSIHAELVELLQAQGARAILFDLLFSERDLYRPDSDAYFDEVLQASDRTYLPVLQLDAERGQGRQRFVELPTTLQLRMEPGGDPGEDGLFLLPQVVRPEAWRSGTINFVADADGVGRRYDVRRQLGGGWWMHSLPARAAADLGAGLPAADRILLHWQSPALQTYPTVSYAAVYAALAEGNPFHDRDFFRDRIVIIGASAAGLHDIKSTPIDAVQPGMYLLATALDNLLNGEYLLQLPAYWRSLASGLLVLALGLLALAVRQSVLLVAAATLLMAGWVMLDWGLLSAGHELGTGAALLLGAAYVFWLQLLRYWRAYRERQRTLQLFGRFLDPRVVQALAEEGLTESAMRGRESEVTVLFSDIRNFTTLSEQHSAAEVLTLLNDYLGRQVAVIFRHGGTLDKFIGDAIMAFWGAPMASDTQAEDAIAAALEMTQVMERFREETGFHAFDIGIGIHTGTAMVGMVGSEQRLDYTVIGDTVNLASRIEGLTKDRARILVSAETRARCGDGTRHSFRDHGEHHVKGRERGVRVFEPL